MFTTMHSDHLKQFLFTLFLGLVMAVGLYLSAGPDLAWLGFAMAAMCTSTPHARGRCGRRRH